MVKQLIMILTTLVGAVFLGGALSSPEQSTVEVTSAIRYEGYFKVIISTNHSSSDLRCLFGVSSRETGTRKILPLQDHRMTVNIVAGHELALTCDQKHYSIFSIPVLDCPGPPEINYGLVTYNGRTAAYSCEPGYIMEGNGVLTCSIRLGIWIPAPPICMKGEDNNTWSNEFYQHSHLSNPVNGYLTLESEAATPTCEHPGTLDNGRVDVRRGTAVNESVYYRCDVGFILNGDSIRTCQMDYTWSGAAPVCTACWLQIQLFGGRHRCEGLLRANYFGFWETICTRDLPDTTKQVICRQLGCGDLIPGRTLQVQSPTVYLYPDHYECKGNERSLCECKNTEGYCPLSNTASSTVNIQCKEGQPGDTSVYIKDPVIELKGGQDPCMGQVIIRGVILGYHSEAIMCDKEATLEMANVMCRQVRCGPPVGASPFEHKRVYTPSRKLVDSESGFKCSGCEPGLGYCNPTKPNCPSTDHVLVLKCAKPEPALTNTDTCSPVKYTPRPVDYKDKSGVEYTCTPKEDILLCPNIVDVNGRCCRGKATSKNVEFNCDPKNGMGPAIEGILAVFYHDACSFK